jgi:hypothetical protein
VHGGDLAAMAGARKAERRGWVAAAGVTTGRGHRELEAPTS